MSDVVYENQRRYAGPEHGEWPSDLAPARQSGTDRMILGVPLVTLAAIGLGALAWYYLGPDLRRYLKLRSM